MVQKTFLGYSFALIATYLVVANATGAGQLLTKGGDTGVKLVKAFQGRK